MSAPSWVIKSNRRGNTDCQVCSSCNLIRALLYNKAAVTLQDFILFTWFHQTHTLFLHSLLHRVCYIHWICHVHLVLGNCGKVYSNELCWTFAQLWGSHGFQIYITDVLRLSKHVKCLLKNVLATYFSTCTEHACLKNRCSQPSSSDYTVPGISFSSILFDLLSFSTLIFDFAQIWVNKSASSVTFCTH